MGKTAKTQHGKSGLQLLPHQIILRPLVTEKGTELSEQTNAYTFEVHPQSDKVQIRSAVEELWGVRVAKVCTQNRKGKPRRHKTSSGVTKTRKKAIVRLHSDDRISFF